MQVVLNTVCEGKHHNVPERQGQAGKVKCGVRKKLTINISLSLLQFLASRYRDNYELSTAIEQMLTLTSNKDGSLNAGKNEQVKIKHLKKKCCAVFSTELQVSQDPEPYRHNRHC